MKRLLALVLVSMAWGCTAQPPVKPGEQTPQALHKSVTRSAEARYLLYLPSEYGKDANQRWPLVIFLHGAGERGDNIEKVKINGPPMLVAKGKQFPFILVSPQCPATSYWKLDDLNAMLDDLLARYKVDPDRVYVTGLSLGGWGTWQWITFHGDRFAAAAPICGGGDSFLIGWVVKPPPVWAFHGEQDKLVPLAESQRMVDAVNREGGSAKLTIYPGVGHDSWKQAYEDPALYEWLLTHRRSANK